MCIKSTFAIPDAPEFKDVMDTILCGASWKRFCNSSWVRDRLLFIKFHRFPEFRGGHLVAALPRLLEKIIQRKLCGGPDIRLQTLAD